MTSFKNPAELSTDNYRYLQQQVYRASGIVLDESKQYLLEARLLPIVDRENLDTLNDLCALMRATSRGPIVQEILEAMTTNETLFFRDTAPFDLLQNTLLPSLIEARKDTRTLSFWSAASSSGQEAYSIAMTLLQMNLADWKIKILGTDISERMIARARTGRYMQIEVNRGLPNNYLERYFTKKGNEWELSSVVRSLVHFEQFDLRHQMTGHGPFDVVFCRNVLIYFDLQTKKTILTEVCQRMQPGGYLFLGAAETTMNVTDAFKRQSAQGTSVYQKR